MSIKKQNSQLLRFNRHLAYCKEITSTVKSSALSIRLEDLVRLYTSFLENQSMLEYITESSFEQMAIRSRTEQLYSFCINVYTRGITSFYLQEAFNEQRQEEPEGILIEEAISEDNLPNRTHATEQSRRLSLDPTSNYEHSTSSTSTSNDINAYKRSRQFSMNLLSNQDLQEHRDSSFVLNVNLSPKQICNISPEKDIFECTVDSTVIPFDDSSTKATVVIQNEHRIFNGQGTTEQLKQQNEHLVKRVHYHPTLNTISTSNTSYNLSRICTLNSCGIFGYFIHRFKDQQSPLIDQPIAKSFVTSCIWNFLVSVDKVRARVLPHLSSTIGFSVKEEIVNSYVKQFKNHLEQETSQQQASTACKDLRKFDQFIRVSVNEYINGRFHRLSVLTGHGASEQRTPAKIFKKFNSSFRSVKVFLVRFVIKNFVEFSVQYFESFNVHAKSIMSSLHESNLILRSILANQEYKVQFKIGLIANDHDFKSQFSYSIGLWHWLKLKMLKFFDRKRAFGSGKLISLQRIIHYIEFRNFIDLVILNIIRRVPSAFQRVWFKNFGGRQELCCQEQLNCIGKKSRIGSSKLFIDRRHLHKYMVWLTKFVIGSHDSCVLLTVQSICHRNLYIWSTATHLIRLLVQWYWHKSAIRSFQSGSTYYSKQRTNTRHKLWSLKICKKRSTVHEICLVIICHTFWFILVHVIGKNTECCIFHFMDFCLKLGPSVKLLKSCHVIKLWYIESSNNKCKVRVVTSPNVFGQPKNLFIEHRNTVFGFCQIILSEQAAILPMMSCSYNIGYLNQRKKELSLSIGSLRKIMVTLLSQIEAFLNSRPLCPISDDINDVSYLTPGHFLIGEAPISLPEVSLLDTKITSLSRWKLIQRIYQQFWKCWYSEYLSRLQQRPKWLKNKENVKAGQLVLLREDDVPPAKWPVARILKVYPGDDDLVRVVKVEKHKAKIKPPIPIDFKKYLAKLKTHKSVFKRPISKISILPIEDNEI